MSMAAGQNFTPEQRASARKMLKKMMFMYFALLNGWQISMLQNGKFQFTRSK
jgi:hypothetical protein